MALSFTGAASSDRYVIATEDYTNLSSNTWTLGVMLYCDTTATAEYSAFSTESAQGGLRIDYDPTNQYPLQVRVEASDGTATSKNLGSADVDDRWGMLIIERTSAADFKLFRLEAGESDVVQETAFAPGFTASNFAGLDLYVGNGEDADQEFQGYIAELWLIEGDTLLDSEKEAVAAGTAYINDYISDANIRFWYSFETADDPEVDFINGVEADRIGTVASQTHPITAYVPPAAGDVDGDLPTFEGDFSAEQPYSCTLDGTFEALIGDFDADHIGDNAINGVFPTFYGTIFATLPIGSDVDGNFPALTGYFDVITASNIGSVDGQFPLFNGDFSAFVPSNTYIFGQMPSLNGFFYTYNSGHLLQEALYCRDTISIESLYLSILESLSAASVSDVLYNRTVALLDELYAVSKTTLSQLAQASESATVESTTVADAEFNVSVLNLLEVVSTLVNQSSRNTSLSEVLSVVEAFTASYMILLANALTADSALTANASLSPTLAEALSVSVSSPIFSTIVDLVTETLGVSASQQVLQNISATLQENINVQFYIELEGDMYLATVLNTETDAMWKYHNFGFNSFNDTLAAKDDGIYLLEDAGDDEGSDIEAEFTTGYSDFGSPNLKRFPSGGIYLRLANDGSVFIRVTSSRQGIVEDDWYEEAMTLDAYDTARVNTHDGLTSRYWKFQVSNSEGSEVNLDAFQMYPITLNRRIR